VGTFSSDLQKHTITMPVVVADGVRSRVGPHGFSAYVAGAVAAQLKRDALDDLLTGMEAEHGPVDEAELARIIKRLSR